MSNTVPEDERLQALFCFFCLSQTEAQTGTAGSMPPSLLTILYLGSLDPKALRELRFFKRFFYIDRSLTAPLPFAPGSLSAYPYR